MLLTYFGGDEGVSWASKMDAASRDDAVVPVALQPDAPKRHFIPSAEFLFE